MQHESSEQKQESLAPYQQLLILLTSPKQRRRRPISAHNRRRPGDEHSLPPASGASLPRRVEGVNCNLGKADQNSGPATVRPGRRPRPTSSTWSRRAPRTGRSSDTCRGAPIPTPCAEASVVWSPLLATPAADVYNYYYLFAEGARRAP